MTSINKSSKIAGWAVFLIALVVYFLTAERTGSLWDCGEFILGAYKLEVVHPPGAPLFMIVGRMFTIVADLFSDNPADIAFAVNLMSGLCGALTAMFVTWITMIFGRMILVGRSDELSTGQQYALIGAGVSAGLATTFTASIWFSAVEGEVYAMSTMFTALTFWAMSKWYILPDSKEADKWIVLSAFCAGLSVGVHLLSILTFPTLALLFYFKKYQKHSLLGVMGSLLAGVAAIVVIQKFIIVGIPTIWMNFEIPMVNSLGLPFHSGLIPTILVIAGLIYFLLRYAHRKGAYILQILTMCTLMVIIGFSVLGVIVIRANADTPVNMNVPTDVVRLLPYLNREQYGERPLLYGPLYDASPIEVDREKRYGRVGDKYEYVDEKYSYKYKSSDKVFFPRVAHNDPGRLDAYARWSGKKGKPSYMFNLAFFFQYQMNWMYWRYFMWNFVGKQNASQGYEPGNKSNGHWISGIKPLDEMKLYNMDELPDTMKNHKGTNKYFFLPLIFGLLGLFYQASKNQKDFFALLMLFVITGIGIIVYSNQPPQEPRERDYVLAGSFFTFCIWIGLGVLALFEQFRKRTKISGKTAALISSGLVLTAPLIMGFQNFDDMSRKDHYGSRDYASNFLESCEKDAIIFTYGDNDTYPLWYAQEVEGIRTDVRVVNLSLIAVDWYIEKLRSKVNDSAPLKLTLSTEAYRGKNRNQVFFYNPNGLDDPIDLKQELAFIGSEKNIQQGQTIMRTKHLYIPVNKSEVLKSGVVTLADTANIVDRIDFDLSDRGSYITKDDLAVMDVIASNIWDRPLYFATTCKNDKLLGLNDYMEFEGLALRLIPVKTASDKTISIYGSGRVDTETMYDNVMNRFKWGNFDTHETFIDESYAAEIQAHRMVMMRAAKALLAEGKKDKAIAMAEKYFEAFPHFNFPYTPYVIPFFDVFVNAGDYEKAKKHMRILAKEMNQYLNFYDSIDPAIVKSSFEFEYMYDLQGVRDMLTISEHMKDAEFDKEMKELLGKYDTRNINN